MFNNNKIENTVNRADFNNLYLFIRKRNVWINQQRFTLQDTVEWLVRQFTGSLKAKAIAIL